MGARDVAAGAYAVIGRFVSGRETLTRIVPGPTSTPEEKCIGFPEQKYINEAGKKGT